MKAKFVGKISVVVEVGSDTLPDPLKEFFHCSNQ